MAIIKRPITKAPTPAPAARGGLLKKKAAAALEPEETAEAEPEQEPEPAPRKGARRPSKSFEDIFNETKPSGGFLAVGQHKAYIVGMELEGDLDGEDKLSIITTYEAHEDDEEAGKQMKNRSQLRTEDGGAGPGIGFFKRDADILGYDEVSLSDVEELCSAVVAERPLVIVTVKENAGYTNIYLQGLAEGE